MPELKPVPRLSTFVPPGGFATVGAAKVNVTIGIDFGTSSTKVFFRSGQSTRETPYACLFEENPVGYPPICLPSTVCVADGKVYFAAKAERRLGGTVYRSFKTCLRCRLTNRYCGHCAVGVERVRPGYRNLPDRGGDVPAEELAAWYLAHVIAEINVRVRANYANEVRLVYNMAAPMDVIEPIVGRDFYERALFIAERMAGTGVGHQGVALASLRFHYNQTKTEVPELQSEGERRTFVVAETRAGVVAYVNSRIAVPGLYALIDIGAGTTDMSIFRLGGDSGGVDVRPDFYSAAVSLAGADRVDQLVLADFMSRAKDPKSFSWESRSEWLGDLRIAKQNDKYGTEVRSRMKDVIPEEMFEGASKKIGTELFIDYKKVLSSAYDKEKRVDRWQDMTMFHIGGGSSIVGISRVLADSPWPDIMREPYLRDLKLPESIACNGNDPEGDCVARHERLLMVAYGLSFPYAAIDEYTMPDGVVVLDPPPLPWRPDWDIGPFDQGS